MSSNEDENTIEHLEKRLSQIEKNEGLDEILDELEEVPTAAKELVRYSMIGDRIIQTRHKEHRYFEVGEIEEWDEVNELIRRKYHEETLEEAVQHGAERERRRILNKIQEKIDGTNSMETSMMLEELEEELTVHGVELWKETSGKIRERTDIDKTAEEVAEELEEEVEHHD